LLDALDGGSEMRQGRCEAVGDYRGALLPEGDVNLRRIDEACMPQSERAEPREEERCTGVEEQGRWRLRREMTRERESKARHKAAVGNMSRLERRELGAGRSSIGQQRRRNE
jgi:hypothetical protein